MRLAIICSFLNQYGGAERVLEVLHATYPDAPFYTSVYRPEVFPKADRDWNVHTSFINRLPMAKYKPQYYLPLYPRAFESFDLRAYDTVLSVTSSFAHGVITQAETRHICYCLSPARFLWNYEAYIERERVGKLARMVLPGYLKGLRIWDHAAADRVDEFVAISRAVQQRILKTYRRNSHILFPPVQIGPHEPPEGPEDYYLIVSRLVPYKRIDLAIEAFNQLGRPLYIAGEGRDEAMLKGLARPNIRFLGYCSDEEKRRLMRRCKAFIFPGTEDFGLTPLEAMATGRPVVAFAAGGALETVIEGETGIFFHEPTPASLAAAVKALDTIDLDPAAIQCYARQFDESVFSNKIRGLLESG